MRIGIALGSNIGDRLANFRAARKAIVGLTGVSGPVRTSSIYETEPVDCEPGAASFFNAVMEFEYDGDPVGLLKHFKGIENSLGRPANHSRNVSRKIDIDLLYAGDMEIENEQLHVPHPRMHLRRFVLAPLAEIRPDLLLPNQKRPTGELLASLTDPAGVVRLKEQW